MTVYQPRDLDKLGKAALAYAERGVPVFPCRPGGKEPLTKNGHLEATADRARINLWWRRWPRANIGIPTGERSGLLVLDVDADKGGIASLEEWEVGEPMPETAMVRTGRGGVHYYFQYPPDGPRIPNSASKLGPGLDVRGEGGYVLAPPSRTEGGYEYSTSRRLAPAPDKLLEAAKSKPIVEEFRRQSSSTVSTDLDGPPIPDGGRNDALTRISGRLHDGERSVDQLDADLQAINEARCQPPLEPKEVSKVARSIYARTPCDAPGPTEETLEVLRGCERELEARAWPKVGGKSDRDVYVVLIKLARKHGKLIAAGVKVSVSIRTLALEAGSSMRTIQKRLWSLRLAGLVRRDGSSAGKGTKAGTFVLAARAEVPHSTTKSTAASSVLPLRAPRLRWSAPGVLRLGKTCGAILDTLEARGGSATVEELADALHVSRVRDFKRRNIARLQERGIVNVFGDNICLVEDWLDALDEERELSGEKDSRRRDEARYERERSAYKGRRKIKRSHHPTNFGADDWTDTLEKLPPRPDNWTLYRLVGKPIKTLRGSGVLWQVIGGEARVVLDADTSRWVALDPSELILEEVA